MSVTDNVPKIHFDRVLAAHRDITTLEKSLALAKVTFDEEPAYLTGEALPPLYTSGMTIDSYFECQNGNIDEGAITGQQGGAHAEHDVYFHAPMHAGQEVTWEIWVSHASITPAGTLTTNTVEIRDLEGNLLVTHLWTSTAIKGTTEFLQGDPLPNHRYPDSARDRQLGSETIMIPADHGTAYFEAAGDAALHSRFLEDALAEGYPGLILQGMCSFGIALGAVMRIAGGGDSRMLRRVAVRFSSPVLLGKELTIEVGEVGPTEDGGREVAFEARQGDTLCLSHGRAEFRPA